MGDGSGRNIEERTKEIERRLGWKGNGLGQDRRGVDGGGDLRGDHL